MRNLVGGIVCAILGMYFFVFRRHFAAKASEAWLVRFGVHISKQAYEYSFFVIGLTFMLVAALALFRLIHFK